MSELSFLSGNDGAQVYGHRWHTQMHMKDMVIQQGLWRTSGTRAKDREENRLDNYPSLALTVNVWANGDSQVDYVSQWALERLPHPWIDDADSSSELSKLLDLNTLSMLRIRDLG